MGTGTTNTLLAIVAGIASSMLAQQASASTVGPTAGFTLRSSVGEAGPASQIDETFDGFGFDGFLTSSTIGTQYDHTHFEFDISDITGPVGAASLNWEIAEGFEGGTIYVDSYTADGVASLSDWVLGQVGAVGTTPSNASSNSLDITALVNASIGLGYLGFSFSISSDSPQAFFWGNLAEINTTVVPLPAAAWLLASALGTVGLGFNQRRVR